MGKYARATAAAAAAAKKQHIASMLLLGLLAMALITLIILPVWFFFIEKGASHNIRSACETGSSAEDRVEMIWKQKCPLNEGESKFKLTKVGVTFVVIISLIMLLGIRHGIVHIKSTGENTPAGFVKLFLICFIFVLFICVILTASGLLKLNISTNCHLGHGDPYICNALGCDSISKDGVCKLKGKEILGINTREDCVTLENELYPPPDGTDPLSVTGDEANEWNQNGTRNNVCVRPSGLGKTLINIVKSHRTLFILFGVLSLLLSIFFSLEIGDAFSAKAKTLLGVILGSEKEAVQSTRKSNAANRAKLMKDGKTGSQITYTD